MKYLLLLLLLPLAVYAGEQSTAKSLYIEEVEYEIQFIIDKRRLGVASEYDDYKLAKLADRLHDLTNESASRVVFTSGIDNREPAEQLTTATKDCGEIYLFTEIRGQTGKTVTHVWFADGEEVYTQTFNVGADRWRVWSAKAVRQSEQLTVLIYSDNELIAVTGINIE